MYSHNNLSIILASSKMCKGKVHTQYGTCVRLNLAEMVQKKKKKKKSWLSNKLIGKMRTEIRCFRGWQSILSSGSFIKWTVRGRNTWLKMSRQWSCISELSEQRKWRGFVGTSERSCMENEISVLKINYYNIDPVETYLFGYCMLNPYMYILHNEIFASHIVETCLIQYKYVTITRGLLWPSGYYAFLMTFANYNWTAASAGVVVEIYAPTYQAMKREVRSLLAKVFSSSIRVGHAHKSRTVQLPFPVAVHSLQHTKWNRLVTFLGLQA